MVDSTKPVRPTEDIKRRFAAGETLMANQIATDYGVSSALLQATLGNLRKKGYSFAEEKVKQPGQGWIRKRFTQIVPAPARDEAAWGPAAGVERLGSGHGKKPRNKKEEIRAKDRDRKRVLREQRKAVANTTGSSLERSVRAVAKMAHSNGSSLAHPVPQLGDKVEVYLLMLDDNGRVNVGLRSPESAWLVGVDGFTARDH